MRPLIWDFGQLNQQVESLYTNQIVSRYVSTWKVLLLLRDELVFYQKLTGSIVFTIRHISHEKSLPG